MTPAPKLLPVELNIFAILQKDARAKDLGMLHIITATVSKRNVRRVIVPDSPQPDSIGLRLNLPVLTHTTAQRPAGAHQFCVRARDDRGQWSTIHSQPFLLTNNSSGVTTITWEMPIGMKAKDGMLVLNSKDNAGRGDCRVEVFAASGVSLASATWPATTSDTSLHVNAPRGSIIVVKVIDATNGQQLLRRLLMN